MATKNTIVVEDRLRSIFSFLPTINTFAPIFKVGDKKELVAFFAESTGNSNYPLIWLDQPYKEEHLNRKRVKVEKMNLILAVETNAQMRYSERMDLTFKPILFPLLDNILDAFTQCNILSYDSTFEVVKFGNYSDNEAGEEGVFPDLWDALKLTISVEINDVC